MIPVHSRAVSFLPSLHQGQKTMAKQSQTQNIQNETNINQNKTLNKTTTIE